MVELVIHLSLWISCFIPTKPQLDFWTLVYFPLWFIFGISGAESPGSFQQRRRSRLGLAQSAHCLGLGDPGKGGGGGMAEVVTAGACGGGTVSWKSIQISPNSCSAESVVCIIGRASLATNKDSSPDMQESQCTIPTAWHFGRMGVIFLVEKKNQHHQIAKNTKTFTKSAIMWPGTILLYAELLKVFC